jgi:undecaprenyl diphosphate synthase
MDGNGRWAKSRMLPRIFGHKKGAEVVTDIVRYCSDMGVSYLTLYTFSMENWLRPKEEVSFLMDLLQKYLEKELDSMMENNIRIMFSGRLELLPPKTKEITLSAENILRENTGMVLNIALSYGGRNELVDAARKMAGMVADGKIKPEDITQELMVSCLYNPDIPDIDLVIRTSGEKRISNFMLWRAAYSEFYFTDCLWPDFDRDELDRAIADFSGRVRRFGMTDEQVGS